MKNLIKINNNTFFKKIIVPSHSKKNINIIDINNSDLNVELIIDVNENAELILNLSSFSYLTNKKFKIIINHLSNDSKSECNTFGISKNNAKINFDLTANIVDESLDNLCKQSINGILLSNDSSIIGSPNLIINTNSIKAKHSLAIGKIKDSRIFYLVSKGLSKREAIFILIMSYFNVSLNNIKDDNIRNIIENKIKDKI